MEVPPDADVAIVGGGFAGVATAWALARSGVTEIVVLEREPQLGAYASGRSAGLGRQLAEDDDTTALTVRGAQILRDDFAPAWTPTGGVLSFDDAAVASDYAARASRFGVPVEPIAPAAVLARWPALGALPIAAALWIGSDGVIDVARLLALFADGVRVALDAGVRSIEPGRRRHRRAARCARGSSSTRRVRGPVSSSARRRSPRSSATCSCSAPTPRRACRGCGTSARGELYVRADPAGMLASPCDATPSAPGDQHRRRRRGRLRSALAERHPRSRRAIVRQWACQRSFTADRQMRLGRDPERPWLVWAAGLGGHGATAAAAVGERVADAVVAALASYLSQSATPVIEVARR